MTADVFISFASKDQKTALTLCSSLEARGVKCWISARDILPGENFQVSIVQAIRRVRIMLLVFTENSNNSNEMTKELALASQQKLIVIPLRVEDVTPSDAFAYEFATRQWIDLFSDWEAAVDQLCHRIVNALAAHAPAPAPAATVAEAAPPVVEAVVLEAPKAEPAPAPAIAAEAPRKRKAAADKADLAAAPMAANDEIPAQSALPRRLLLAAAVIAVVASVGLVVPTMMKPKAPTPSPMLAVARLQPTQPATAQPGLPAPGADAATAALPGTEEATTPRPKRKARKTEEAVHSDIPY